MVSMLFWLGFIFKTDKHNSNPYLRDKLDAYREKSEIVSYIEARLYIWIWCFRQKFSDKVWQTLPWKYIVVSTWFTLWFWFRDRLRWRDKMSEFIDNLAVFAQCRKTTVSSFQFTRQTQFLERKVGKRKSYNCFVNRGSTLHINLILLTEFDSPFL